MAPPIVPRQSSDSYSSAQAVSHGRGGAGNMSPEEHPYEEYPEDIRIPTLKSPVYTTGRGGTGNMAINDSSHPELARAAQDVEDAHRRPSSPDSFHGGRGGAGNVVHSADADLVRLRLEEEERQHLAALSAKLEPVDHSKIDYRGWADKGKDFLRGVTKKKGK